MNLPANFSFQRAHGYLLALLTGTLSVTVLLKVGEIQYLELFLALDLFFVGWLFARNRYRAEVLKPFFSLSASYAIFFVAVFLLALYALRGNFYPYTFTFLKRPMLVTVARMAELFLDVFYMIYMASLYREDRALCRFGVKVYFWTGVAGCLFSIATYPFNVLFGIDSGTYTLFHRMRGFDNEGGSFGTYLISVIFLTLAMRHRNWLTPRQYYGGMALFLLCFLGAQAKGGFLAFAIVALFYLMVSLTGIRRWLTVAATAGAFLAVALSIDLPAKINTYFVQSALYAQVSNLHYGDGNYVMGRVAGAVLAPRMIAAHPWAGIGWGNYVMVRDDPAYRQGTAFSITSVDAPGLGPVDYIVEFGIPLWLYFTWINLKPIFLMRRIRADPALLALAFVQPISNWAGAHLNLMHPWVVVGFALGMAYSVAPPEATSVIPSSQTLTLSENSL